MPNLWMVGVAFVVGIWIISASANHEGKKDKELIAKADHEGHFMTQDEPHPGAWVLAAIVCFILIYLAAPK